MREIIIYLSILLIFNSCSNSESENSKIKSEVKEKVEVQKELIEIKKVNVLKPEMTFNINNDVEFIKNYYYNHTIIWASDYGNWKTNQYKIDSLQRKYIANQLRIEYKEYEELGHNHITFDNSINLNDWDNFSVYKDSLDDNWYNISFNTERTLYPGKDTIVSVLFKVELIEQNNKYLINNIKE